MKNMTPEQREAAQEWAKEWRKVLGLKPTQDKPHKTAYTLDTDCHPPLLEAPPK